MKAKLLHQLSDLPWLLVAGASGLVLEGALLASGLLRAQAAWVPAVAVLLLHGGALGFVSFTFGRSAAALAAGAAIGVAWGVSFGWLGWEVWAAPAAPWAGGLLRGLMGAAVAAWTARLVDPWLLRGPLGRLASHHPRYAHLRR